MLRALLFLGLMTAAVAGAAEPFSPGDYGKVDVAPTKTSVYVAVVSMAMPTFERHGATYSAKYQAKVIPFFFFNEKGTLTVDVTDEQLRQLALGHPVTFTGRAVRDDGAQRAVDGKATPGDANSGTLKVRVRYSKRIELVFNTTYRFRQG